jgi:hypothetical protein
MKIKLIQKLALCGAFFAFGTGLDKAFASVLLSIDDSNPSAVTITATGLNSAVNDSGSIVNSGVDLLSFYTADEQNMTFGQFLTGALEGGNSGVPYNDVYSDFYSTDGGAFYDLELYVDISSTGANNTETFSTTQPAFAGSWTIDFSSLGVDPSVLPTAGSQGNILSGYSGSPGPVIGTWQVASPVPEPAVDSLLALGLLATGMAIYRRQTGVRWF